MRESGALYVRLGDIEVTLGPAPVTPDEPAKEAAFVHDGADTDVPRKRRNPLLDHPSLRR
jgi:hypothetical protein